MYINNLELGMRKNHGGEMKMGVLTWYNLLLLFGFPVFLFGVHRGIWDHIADPARKRGHLRRWQTVVRIIGLVVLIAGLYGLVIAVLP